MRVRRHVPHADGERIPYPVEVRADADGINAGNTGHIVDVVQNMLQGRPEIGVFRSVGGPPGLRRFAIPGFAAFPKVGLESLRGLFAAPPGGLAEEGGADVDHDDAAFIADCPEQIVVRVAQEARDEMARAGVGGNDRNRGELEDLLGRLVRYVGKIQHDAGVVQRRNQGLSEGR